MTGTRGTEAKETKNWKEEHKELANDIVKACNGYLLKYPSETRTTFSHGATNREIAVLIVRKLNTKIMKAPETVNEADVLKLIWEALETKSSKQKSMREGELKNAIMEAIDGHIIKIYNLNPDKIHENQLKNDLASHGLDGDGASAKNIMSPLDFAKNRLDELRPAEKLTSSHQKK
ncbi:MAG: hypothetical protein ABI597_12870 [Gammaproteobacteria bacterium]